MTEDSYMNGLLWILLLCCCGKNNGCGCINSNSDCVVEERRRCAEHERSSCPIKDRETTWTPYMGNASEHDNSCGCEHNH